jgi:carbon-monoxide dehydrogenase medium subunit
MKPAPFAYTRARSLDEALGLLSEHGEEARILAGGQSLLPTLNMRLSAPVLRIGAAVTHSEVLGSKDAAAAAPLIVEALNQVAHPAIRNKGTFGGSMAHADPAAELPACAVALGATIEITGKGGARSIPAGDFFEGLYETALRPGEILTAVEIPKARPEHRSRFMEFSRRAGDFAMAGLAAHMSFSGDGLSDVRLVFCGVDIKPVMAHAACAALEGANPTVEAIEAAREKLADDLDPPDDPQAAGATKLHLARVLMGRVLTEIAEAA